MTTRLLYLTDSILNAVSVRQTGAAYEVVFTDGTSRAVADAELLPAAKAEKLAQLRDTAASVIIVKWPTWAQTNCALGIYPEATAAQCSADIAAVVTASNAAEDAVAAATTVAEVEAVTATWPAL